MGRTPARRRSGGGDKTRIDRAEKSEGSTDSNRRANCFYTTITEGIIQHKKHRRAPLSRSRLRRGRRLKKKDPQKTTAEVNRGGRPASTKKRKANLTKMVSRGKGSGEANSTTDTGVGEAPGLSGGSGQGEHHEVESLTARQNRTSYKRNKR